MTSISRNVVHSMLGPDKRMSSVNEEEIFTRGFHGIPDDKKLKAMSFTELASELASSEKDSPKSKVIEREIKRHLAKDQADINLPNMLWAAGFGGIFALAGVVLGWYLNMSPATEQIAPAGAVQQMKNSNFTKDPPSRQVVISSGAGSSSINKPTPKNSNENPSN